jgi:hypothetical protein
MGSLGRHCLRAAALGCSFVMLLAMAAGLVRLLPWLVAPSVPLSVSGPFARALCAVALETSVLLGIPVGFALGAAVFVERGEARALLTLGASPWRLVVGALPHALVLAALALLALRVGDLDAQVPGRVAAALIVEGRRSCQGAREARSAVVPVVGVTWLCFPGRSPRVVGTVPRLGDRVWFSASELRPSPDLTEFAFQDLRIVTRRGQPGPNLRLEASRALVSGLPPWGRPAKLPGAVRGPMVAGFSVALALLLAWFVIAASLPERLAAASTGALSALAALQMLHAVDNARGGNLAYLWVPAVGVGVTLVCSVAAIWIRRFVSSRPAAP